VFKELHIDFETRSAVDLKKRGLDPYIKDPTTDVWVCCFAFDEGDVFTWTPGMPCPKEIFEHLFMSRKVIGHNVNFELNVINHIMSKRYGWPQLHIEQCECTMIMAYNMALPGALENAVPAVGITDKKDMAGHRLMIQMSKPRKPKKDEKVKEGELLWWDTPDKLKKLYGYCKQDVIVERKLHKLLLPLSKEETKVWFMDHKINARGLQVDIPAAESALEIIDLEKINLDKQMTKVSRGEIASCNAVADIKRFVNCYAPVTTENVNAKTIEALLLMPNLPPKVRTVLLLRQAAAKTSTRKLQTMITSASDDGRLRGIFQYLGANTGRWAGRRVQPHNFPRPSIPQSSIENVFDILNCEAVTNDKLHYIETMFGSPLDIISQSLRGFLIAKPGHRLLGADFSAIEARVIAWLAGQENILEIFKGDGKVYEHAASAIFNVPIDQVTPYQRQVGKVAVLALGYQGGKNAFQKMAVTYDVKVTDKEAEAIKVNWREANPFIVALWHKVERAAFSAVQQPSTKFSVKNIHFMVRGSFLWCQLPSKRVICYPYPELKGVETPWKEIRTAITYMGVDSLTKKWIRKTAYGGLLCENITQAVARDLMAKSMLLLEKYNYPVVLHVHDEVVCEVKNGYGCLNDVLELMCAYPDWAKGLPIKAEGFEGMRYRK